MTARKKCWQGARRLLAVRTDNLGDVLMTTPALHAMKCTSRGSHLTLMTSPAGAALAPHLPFVDDVLTVRAPWVKGDGHFDELRQIVERIRAGCFDAAIIFTTCTQSALPAATALQLAGVPLRLAHCRENPYALLTDWIADPEPALARHEVLRQLALVDHVGMQSAGARLRFTLHRPDVERVRGRLRSAGIEPGRQYLVVHPGASASSRRYPADRFGAALRLIGADLKMPAVIVGSRSESTAIEAVRQHAGSALPLVTLDDLALGELAALIAGSALLICNNSGPAHLAAALRTPLVELYALTNPQHTPWGVPARVLYQDVPCRNCLKSVCPRVHHACLLGVSPLQVAEAALEMLTGTPRRIQLRVTPPLPSIRLVA
jgi:ADP-heptose:LPS heptosyltransferase